MSEQAVDAPGDGSSRTSNTPPGRGRKVLGMNRGTAIGVGVVGLAVVIVLILRARSKNAAAAAGTSSTTGSCPDGSTPDANGNCPQNSADFSGQLETLQSEIAALQGAMGSGAGGGGSAGTVGAATGTTTAPPTTAPVTTGSPASTQAPPRVAAGPISNLQATTVGTTTATLRWNAAQGATGGYSYQYAEVGKGQGAPHPTRATTATLTGLKPKTTYNFGVQGLPGGPGNNTHFTTK